MSQYRNLGKRHEGGGAWRWLMMGAVLAFGCSAALFLAVLTFEWATLGVPTERLVIATATVDTFAPAAVSQTPWIITATSVPISPTPLLRATATPMARNANSPTGRECHTAPWRC